MAACISVSECARAHVDVHFRGRSLCLSRRICGGETFRYSPMLLYCDLCSTKLKRGAQCVAPARMRTRISRSGARIRHMHTHSLCVM